MVENITNIVVGATVTNAQSCAKRISFIQVQIQIGYVIMAAYGVALIVIAKNVALIANDHTDPINK